MSDEKKGTITITVPFIEAESGLRGPYPVSDTMADGRRFVGAARDNRSVMIAEADIAAAVFAAWPVGTVVGDYTKRLAEIEAWAAKLGALEDEQIERMPYEVAVRHLGVAVEHHVPWLLSQLRAASAALTEAGIPDDGHSLAERVALLRREADSSSEVAERALRERESAARYVAGYREQVDRLQTWLDAEKLTKATALRDLDILRRAALAAVAAMGGKVQGDAGPETIAAALRGLAEDVVPAIPEGADLSLFAAVRAAARRDATIAKLPEEIRRSLTPMPPPEPDDEPAIGDIPR